jgi:2-dehydro-3-deoxygluconokinase
VISALLEGKTLQQAVKRGNKIGSLAIQVRATARAAHTRSWE